MKAESHMSTTTAVAVTPAAKSAVTPAPAKAPAKAAAKAAAKAPVKTAAQPAPKAAVKRVAKPAAKASADAKPVKPVKPVKAVKVEKPVKPKLPKAKLVRDSFTMPQADFNLVAVLKTRALGFKRPTKKSELLRAGLHALQALGDSALRKALDTLVPLKPGRPKNEV